MKKSIFIIPLIFLLPFFCVAQYDIPVDEGGETYSLGMPPIYKKNAGATFGWIENAKNLQELSDLRVLFHAGLGKDIGSPIVGLLGLEAEVYGGFRGYSHLDGGLRGMLTFPSLHFAVGYDYNLLDELSNSVFRVEMPLFRGGLFGAGSQLRFDFIYGETSTLALGINVPLWGGHLGETRPKQTFVKLLDPDIIPLNIEENPIRNDVDDIFSNLYTNARYIAQLVSPITDSNGDDPEKYYGNELLKLRSYLESNSEYKQHTLEDEVKKYHDLIEQAYVKVLADNPVVSAQEVANVARRIVLDYVLLPYNSNLGSKKKKDGLTQFEATANAEFSEWIIKDQEIPDELFDNLFYVFQSTMHVILEIHKFQKTRWKDDRLLWMPLQLGLRNNESDSFDEINTLIEKATNSKFQKGNTCWYAMNEEFSSFLDYSIKDAEDYHVLWIHDFRGHNAEGDLDIIAFNQMLIYLEAFTDNINQYDIKGSMPSYFLFLDQHFYEINKGRIFLKALEDPLRYKLKLPKGYEEWEQKYLKAQNDLKRAVAESKLLQTEIRQFGIEWLYDRIQLNINITNPADHSFVNRGMIKVFPLPDNMIRDHRKVVFYDLSENDADKGKAVFTGMGVGEHYVGSTWEDRAMLLIGPSALKLKTAARELMERQGFKENEIPFPFRAIPFPSDYEDQLEALEASILEAYGPGFGEALQLHNRIGYSTKNINVAKAIMYSLLPTANVIFVPDSLWMNCVYASLLAGSAMRGCQVLFMTTTLATAPSSAKMTMARVHANVSAVVYFRNFMQKQIEASGGVLNIGMYNPHQGVGDMTNKLKQAKNTIQSELSEVIPLRDDFINVMDSVEYYIEENHERRGYLINKPSTEKPMLHMKADFSIDYDMWKKILESPKLSEVLELYLQYQIKLTRVIDAEVNGELMFQVYSKISELADDIDPSRTKENHERFALLTMGSTNMDYMSMVLNGEVQVLVYDWSSIIGMLDMIVTSGQCDWVKKQEDIDKQMPPPNGFYKWLGNYIKLLL